MSMEVLEQSHGMDEDRQHPNDNMPKKLKKVAAAEDNLRERQRRGSLDHSRQMEKVPPVLRKGTESNDYDPVVVALGPYHHGRKRLQYAENFKVKALQETIVYTGKSVQFYFDEVFKRVSHVRSFYTEDSTKKFSDSAFAQMMLIDTCFIISCILAPTKPCFAAIIFGQLGLDLAIIYRDLFLLENQVPLWLLKHVMQEGYGLEPNVLIDEFIYKVSYFSRSKRKQIDIFNPDIHLLDACRLVLLSECNENSVHPYCKFRFDWHKWTYVFRWLMTPRKKVKNYDKYSWEEQYLPWFHSALDLKTKGIHFIPSQDYSLTGLCFKSGYHYPQLQLPILHVSTHTKSFFSNLIAYESQLYANERKVTAYIKFMKLLIFHADDVKELREKGILFTSLGSDEEVVKMFKELNTSILSTEEAFETVKVEIQKHIRSKFKTRLGEFLYIYFRTPWTTVGTIAAVIFLVLTLVQTYFAIRCS